MQLPQFDHLANLPLILFLQHSRTGDCEVNRQPLAMCSSSTFQSEPEANAYNKLPLNPSAI